MEELTEQIAAEDRRSKCMELCRLRGLITDDVDEINDLNETKLLVAAAEGWCVRSKNLIFF